MIDLKLTEIFGILGVGLFVMISLVYLYFLRQRLFNIRRHNKDAFFNWLKGALQGSYKDSAYAIVTGLLVYITGLLTQDVTDHMTDSERNFNPVISFVKNVGLLDTEGELRKAVLIESDTKLTGLGREVFGNYKQVLNLDSTENNIPFFNKGDNAQKYWEENGPVITDSDSLHKELRGLIARLYYTSKNWCYLKAEPIHKELGDIQERIDFSRSISIVSFLAALFILLFYLVYYMYEFSKRRTSRFKVISTERTQQNFYGVYSVKRKIHRRVFFPYRALLILGLIIYVSRICYTAAEKNFNERAMGYYVSQFKFSKEKSAEDKLTVVNKIPLLDTAK